MLNNFYKYSVRKRIIKAQMEYHTDRFRNMENMAEEELARIMDRAKIIGVIWNIFFGTGNSIFSEEDYLYGMY